MLSKRRRNSGTRRLNSFGQHIFLRAALYQSMIKDLRTLCDSGKPDRPDGSAPELRHVSSIIQAKGDSCCMGHWSSERAYGPSFQLDDHAVRPAVDTIITKKREFRLCPQPKRKCPWE